MQEMNYRKFLVELVKNTPELKEKKWDAKKCIQKMKNSNFNNWNQDEWVGFYFEFIARQNHHKGMTPFSYRPQGSNMKFDWIILDYPADLKAESIELNNKLSTMTNVLLNDQKSIKKSIKEHKKLYYIILFGTRKLEELRELKNWKESKLVKKQSEYCKNGENRKHRKLKLWYAPKKMILCEINELNMKYLSDFKQGHQPNFWMTDKTKEQTKRNTKYQFYKKLLHHFILAELDLEPYQMKASLQ